MPSKPSVNRIGETLTVDFDEEMVHATLDRWRTVGGDLWAELTLRTSQPGLPPHLHQSRWNLCSLSQRQEMARHLGKRFEGMDWPELVERIATSALAEMRRNIRLSVVGRMARQGIRWIAQPLLTMGDLTMLYGKGGSGKSWLMTTLAVSLLSRRNLLSLGMTRDEMPPLYLDWEAGAETANERVAMICAGAGIEPVEMPYMECAGALADQVENIRAAVREYGSKVLIADSVGPACGGEPESAEVVLRMVNALRSLPVTALLIDHPPKGREDEVFGSSYKMYSARSVWQVESTADEERGRHRIGLIHRKASNTRRWRGALGWNLTIDERAQTAAWERDDAGVTVEMESKVVSLSTRITALLADRRQPATVKDLADLLGAEEPVIRVRCAELARKGRLVKVGEGEKGVTVWGLAAPAGTTG